MAVEKINDHGQTINYPLGKILGILDKRSEFASLSQELVKAGFDDVELFEGEDGVQLLDRVNGFFFSDMEERVLNKHAAELKAGHVVVMIKTPDDRIDAAVGIANFHGVRGIVHFGAATVTQYTSLYA